MKLTESKLRQIIREELGLHTITIPDPEKIAKKMGYFEDEPYDYDLDGEPRGVQGLYDDLGERADEGGGLMMSGSGPYSGKYTPLLIQGPREDLVAFVALVRRELGGRLGLPQAFEAAIAKFESSL